MKNQTSVLKSCVLALLINTTIFSWSSSDLHLTQHDVLETHGLSVLLFHNEYHRVFGDQKMNGMEIILHDQRIATGGDVRLSATPEQWDPIPDFKQRKRGTAPDEITAFCTYTDQGYRRRIHRRRVTITSESGPILLFDGRNKAQNGWFVVRTVIPSGKTGDVVVWHVHPNVISRAPHSLHR